MFIISFSNQNLNFLNCGPWISNRLCYWCREVPPNWVVVFASLFGCCHSPRRRRDCTVRPGNALKTGKWTVAHFQWRAFVFCSPKWAPPTQPDSSHTTWLLPHSLIPPTQPDQRLKLTLYMRLHRLYKYASDNSQRTETLHHKPVQPDWPGWAVRNLAQRVAAWARQALVIRKMARLPNGNRFTPKASCSFFLSGSIPFLQRRNVSFVSVRGWRRTKWRERKACWRITACWRSRGSCLWRVGQVWESAPQTEAAATWGNGRQCCLQGLW